MSRMGGKWATVPRPDLYNSETAALCIHTNLRTSAACLKKKQLPGHSWLPVECLALQEMPRQCGKASHATINTLYYCKISRFCRHSTPYS